MKTYEIDFSGNVLAEIEVDGDNIKVLRSMNGWGESIPNSAVSINEV